MSDPTPTKFEEGTSSLYVGNDLGKFQASSPLESSFTFTSEGKKIVSIGRDGKVTLGEGVTHDEAAMLFWNAVMKMGVLPASEQQKAALKRVLGAIRHLPPGGELRRRLTEYEFGYNHNLFFKDVELLEKLL